MKSILALAALALTGCVATYNPVTDTAIHYSGNVEPTAYEVAREHDMVVSWIASAHAGPIITREGCYMIVLTERMSWGEKEQFAGCAKDERYATGMPNGVNGERRMMYDACYKRVGNVLELRWPRGKPKGLREYVLRKPFPDSPMSPFPATCKFPETRYPRQVQIVR
jgi:hypothetical protein